MNSTLAVWLNRAGILLEFASFWFAAPELLGEKRLRAIERRLEKPLRRWHRLSLMKRTDLLFLLGGLITLTLGAILLRLPWPSSWQDIGRESFPVAIAISGLLGLLVIVAGTLAEQIMTKLAIRLLRHMIDDEDIRQRSLVLGAFLFVLGTILQFTGTF